MGFERTKIVSRLCIALAVVAGVSPEFALGDRRGHARCEWIDCDKSGGYVPPADRARPSAAGSGVSPEYRIDGGGASPSGAPECASEDRFACQEECRTLFDSAYHRCVDKCLSGRGCTAAPPPAPPSNASRGDADVCIEGESAGCVSTCNDNTTTEAKSRCRLACLSRLCPYSKKSDMAQEAASPGSARCDRCKAREERECRRTCRVGLAAGSGGSFSGLSSFGCEKACLMTACGSGCVF